MKPPEDMPSWRLFVLRSHIWLLASIIPLLVRALSVPRLTRLLTPPAWFRPYEGVPADRLAALTAHRLRRPRNMRRRACLREGLTLFHFLRLAGLPAVLNVGVYPPSADPRRIHAHCWVTLDGVCVSTPGGQPVAVMFTSDSGEGLMR